MSFQDFRANSLDKLQLGLMIGRAHITIGSMKVQILPAHGCYHKECGDGLNGMTELTSCLLTNPRQDGIISQTVDLILNKILDMVSTTQNMFITTIFILMLMKNPDNPEEFRVPAQINSFKKVNSPMNQDGENTKTSILFKKKNHLN